jgi:hypothetical protein
METVSHPDHGYDGFLAGADPEQFELWVEDDDEE